MRKVASKLRCRGRGSLAALILAVGVLGLLLLGSSVKADEPQFNASAGTDISDPDCKANAEIYSMFDVDDDPWPAAYYQAQVSFIPSEWGVAESADIPIGAAVGEMDINATVGWFNNPCSSAFGGGLAFSFDPLMNCSIDSVDTCTYDEQFDDGANGIKEGCNKYPDFLNELFPGMTPVARHAGFYLLGGSVWVSLNFMTFPPGTDIPDTAVPGTPPFGPELGYVAMSVLQDPTAPLVKNQITDNCPPLHTETTYYGLTQDNPQTAVDESGYEWRWNPNRAGTYTFNGYTHSYRDADNDDIDNALDTCPHIANAGDPKLQGSAGGDNDNDGLDNVCDPTPSGNDTDPDGDGFPNRQDNCPLVYNEDQADGDKDAIGDVCDQDDWNDDGDITDPGEPTGFSPSVPNGDKTALWFAGDVEVYGPSCPEPGDDDGDGFENAVEADLGSCWADPCDDADFCSGTEAVDSTPEDTSESGTCSDTVDNDRDGYVDDIDGGCGDDTDGDGVSDDGEDELGSDPEDSQSTPEDASVCDVCSDGVDNDLDGDIDAADAGCAAATVTPTVTATATETAEPVDVSPTPTEEPSVEDICAPVFPGTYSGSVRIEGQPAASGYEVTASVAGVEWGSAIVSAGRYAMDIPDHLPSAPPCFEGGTITFALNGMTCTASPDAEWAAGLQAVDLDCAPAAPPVTPTEEPATPTTPAAPTVTPVSPPPSGGGGLAGSGTGLPLWALALASWAGLTIVAGLGTLVAVKRR